MSGPQDEWFTSEAASRRVSAQRQLPVAASVAAIEHQTRGLGFPQGPVMLRPLLVPQRSYDEMFTAARKVIGLLRRALLDAAPTWQGRLAALGEDETVYPACLFMPDPVIEERYSTSLARPDAIVGPDGLKFLEFNITGVIGGAVESQMITQAMWKIYGGRRGAPFTGSDPLAGRADMFAAICRELQAPPSAALLGTLRYGLCGGNPGTDRYFELELDYLRRRGMTAEYFEPDDLLSGIGYPGRSAFSVGLRHFAAEEWRSLGIDLEPIGRALAAGCLLLSTQTGRMIGNKKVMAWVSEGLPWMTDAERELADSYLPWTRLVRSGKTLWRGRRFDTIDLITSRREQFVLKRASGFGGKQVTIGQECGQAAWDAAVQAALDGDDSVVQEHVQARRCLLEMADGADGEPYEVSAAPVLSPFLCGGRRAGCMVRYHPTGAAGIVSCYLGALASVVMAARQPG